MSIKNNQKGSILVFSLSIMSIVLAISLSVLAIYIPKLKTIRETANSMGAIYSADSIIEWCIYEARTVGDAAVPVLSNGATYTLDANSPPFGSDLCPYAGAINHRAVGTFGGVSRSLEVGEVVGP